MSKLRAARVDTIYGRRFRWSVRAQRRLYPKMLWRLTAMSRSKILRANWFESLYPRWLGTMMSPRLR